MDTLFNDKNIQSVLVHIPLILKLSLLKEMPRSLYTPYKIIKNLKK